MEDQSYAKHAKFVPAFHFFLMPLLLVTFIGSLVNLWESFGDHSRLYNAALIAAMAFGLVLAALFARVFALGAQDKAIRAEENLRHFVITGKLLDRRLTQKQIVGLRFASDEEFVALAAKAANEGMQQDDIKKSIKSWRADHERL
jgi:hypothetical protein